ncbi:MAG: glutathione peroxidase [Saprospiraceae bacterium]|nr:glutathione peroxidase [Saprospiraceae bacterium]
MKIYKFLTLSILLATLSSFALYTANDSGKTVHDFTMKDIDGNDVELKSFKGKTLLIVNVASKCGLTPQYEELQALYEKHKDQGLVILGFPANNFMGQEPGSDSKIKEFCTSKFNVTFPMFSKISVKGGNIHPLYKFLTQKSENGKLDAPVKWNFQKFLVNSEGEVVASFKPGTSVNEKEVTRAIEKLLDKKS